MPSTITISSVPAARHRLVARVLARDATFATSDGRAVACCRRVYERHGFEVTEEFRLPKGGPPLWRMWREPQPR